MKEFYPIQKSSEAEFKFIHESEGRSFYCIDWTDELVIYGDFTMDNSLIDIILAPCNYRFTEHGYTDDTVSDECIWDLEQ